MRVMVAGGGTGGHVIPALAIAHELRAHYRAEVLFVGTQRGIETRLVPAAGFELRLIKVGALKRVDFATRLKTLLALPRALAASARIVREFRPRRDDRRRRLRFGTGDVRRCHDEHSHRRV